MVGVPLDHSRAGGIKQGADHATPSQYDLWDRIINIRFNRKKRNPDGTQQYFVLRSDYEVVLANDGTPYFQRITQKPDISVRYFQVSNGVAIKIEVRVAAMYISKVVEGDSIFTDDENPITDMVIQMGYRSQFPNWTDPALAFDRDGEPNRLDLFNQLANFKIKNVPDLIDSGLQINVKVLDTRPEGLPPDRVIMFNGIVGHMKYGLSFTDPGNLSGFIDEPTNFPTPSANEPWSPIEQTLFTCITRRFPQIGINYELIDNRDVPGWTQGMPIEQTLRVRDYNVSANTWYTPAEQAGKEEAARWAEIPLIQGMIPVKDAVNLGIMCYCSPTLRRLSRENTTARAYTIDDDETANKDIVKIPFVGMKQELSSQLLQIRNCGYPDIRFSIRPTGDIFFYHKSEELTTVVDDESFSAAQRERQPILLPAVYDITITGLRVIRCPFVSFISPGQTIGFSSRYNIADLVGFFYPHTEDKWFKAILTTVEFGTVNDQNMMTIQCTDVPTPAESSQSPTITAPEQATAAAGVRTEQVRALKWAQETITESYTGVAGETAQNSWHGFAMAALNNPNVQGLEEAPTDMIGMMAFLIEHNSDKNTEWQARGKGEEARAYPALDPWPAILYVGDALELPSKEVQVT